MVVLRPLRRYRSQSRFSAGYLGASSKSLQKKCMFGVPGPPRAIDRRGPRTTPVVDLIVDDVWGELGRGEEIREEKRREEEREEKR